MPKCAALDHYTLRRQALLQRGKSQSRRGGDPVRVFGCPEGLAVRLEAIGYDIPASEIEAGMELHLPCLAKIGQDNKGYKTIEAFWPGAAE